MANAEVSKAVQQDDLTVSARFTNLVLKEFTASVGGIEVSPAQRSLIQGYFIGCDMAIATNEDDRWATCRLSSSTSIRQTSSD